MNNPVQLNARKLNLRTLKLERGAHSPDHTFCVMEAVAYIAGEEWSDRPKCASNVIGAFMRSWNDDLDDKGRQISVHNRGVDRP